jgi:hypothetical protein
MYCSHLQGTSKILGYFLYTKKQDTLFSKLNILYILCKTLLSFAVELRTNEDHGLLILDVCISHKMKPQNQ